MPAPILYRLRFSKGCTNTERDNASSDRLLGLVVRLGGSFEPWDVDRLEEVAEFFWCRESHEHRRRRVQLSHRRRRRKCWGNRGRKCLCAFSSWTSRLATRDRRRRDGRRKLGLLRRSIEDSLVLTFVVRIATPSMDRRVRKIF